MYPCISHPTRFDKDLNCSLIDNIFYNGYPENLTSGNLICHVSDHLQNFLIIPSEKLKTHKQIFRRDLQNFNLQEFKSDLKATKLEMKLKSFDDPDGMYNFFHNTLSILFEMHCPIKKVSNREAKYMSKRWMTDNILEKITEREVSYQNYLDTGNEEFFKHHLALKKEVNHSIRRNKFFFQKRQFDLLKNNTKKLWKQINLTLSRTKKQPIPDIMYRGNKRLQTKKDISQNFNEHFSKVAPNLLKSMKLGKDPIKNIPSVNKSMCFLPTTKDEVEKLLDQLNPSKAPDINNFQIKVIKDAKDLISSPLAMIFNCSIKKGIFPSKLKIAKVTPVFKNNGNKHDMKNYRPISVLPLFDKIFEQIVQTRLNDFLSKNNILSDSQFGFQNGKSTADAVLNLTDDIYSALKENKTCCTILLDLAKAFDTVDHSILLKKLDKIGIRGPLHKWFESYLKDRKQVVSIDNVRSDNMAFGVPQGSVLGPILFLIFINDMPLSSRLFRYTLFADDTFLFMSHEDPKTLEDLVNSELENIDQWLIDNRLSLNVDKSCFLLFTGKTRFQQDFKICISDKEVSRVSAAKYLGVHIDDKLNWQLHLSHVLTKIKQGLGALRKIKHVISPFNLTSSTVLIIQSHLQYCVTS